MEAVAAAPALLTPAEYLAWEATQFERHEFYEGEIIATPGVSLAHNSLTLNLAFFLRAATRGQGCRVYATDVKLGAADESHYTYPDVMISCDPGDRGPYIVRQPVLLAEVLSPATEEFDRTEKFIRYQQLPSLRHYLLVSQISWAVEWLRRDEAGQWIYTLVRGANATLTIPELTLTLPLVELYADTDVAVQPPRPTEK